jgi:hypothetical protein
MKKLPIHRIGLGDPPRQLSGSGIKGNINVTNVINVKDLHRYHIKGMKSYESGYLIRVI